MRGDEYGDTDARPARFGWLGRAAIRRAIADRALLAPALVCCILATTLSAAGPIFSSAVATAGVRAALARAPATASNLRVTAPVHAAPSAELDGQATRAIAAATAPAGAAIGRQLRSGSFTVDGRAELVELAWFDDADAVTAVAGAMPSRVGEIAAPEPVARALGWSAGDSVVLRDTTTDAPTRVTVSALYRAGDADAVRWWGAAPVAGTDWRRGGFTIYGPLLTTRDTLLDRLGADQAWWTATLAIERLDAGDVDRVRRATDGFVSRSGDGLDVTTGLPSLLDAAGQRLLASRAAVLTVVLQLLVLAVAALVLAAQLIVSERSVETALLRSRGAGIGQLAAIAAIEAVLVVAPAVAVGPPLGRIVVAMLDDAGALRAAGLVLQPTVTASSMLLSAAAGAVAAVALWLPTVAAERGFAASQRARGRQRRAGAAQRLGVDLALLAVAAVGYWQLRQADGPLTTGVRGAVGVDPLLVAAPALCLLTGAVLALRAVPFLAGLAERVAVTGHGIIPALGAWQVARRPRGYARAALLPVLAIGLGSFAVSYGSTRDAAQASQVATVVPADLRVTPGRSAEVTPARLPGAYLDLPGVTGVVPALQATVPISPDAGRAGVLAVDTGGRDLLSAGPDLRTAMATLARGRPALPVVRLPAGTVRLEVAVTTTLTVPPAGDPTTAADPFAAGGPQVHLLIRDRFGLVHALAAGDLPADGDPSPLRVDLDGLARPLALAGVDLDLPVDPFTPYRCRVGVSVRDDHGGTVRLQPGWSARTAARDAALVTPRAAAAPGPGAAAALDVRRSPGGPTRALVHLLPAGGTPPDDVGVVLTGPLARTLEVERGGRLPLQVAGLALDTRVVAIVDALPALPDDAPAGGALLDLGALAAASFATAQEPIEPTTWLLTVDGPAAPVAGRLRGESPAGTEVLDRAALTAQARDDPVTSGVIGALSLGFAGAAVLAALGFVVAAVASIRERASEFAVLRAIGLSGRQLSSAVLLEHGALLTGALVGGVLLGGVMSWAILPYVALDATGVRPATRVAVHIAWSDIAGLVCALAAVIVVAALLLAGPLRRARPGPAMRAGEED